MKGKTTFAEMMNCPNRILHTMYYNSYKISKARKEFEEKEKRKQAETKNKDDSNKSNREMLDEIRASNIDIDDLEDLID